MSTFKCPVVRIDKIGKHPNADNLSIWNGPQGPLVFKNGQFKDGDLAVFVPADSLVDLSRNEFQFLAGDKKEGLFRIRGIKLRGIPSVGLILPANGLSEGDDGAQIYGVTKYVPEQTHSFFTSSDQAPTPNGVYVPTYDVENHWQFEKTLIEGTSVECMDFETTWHISQKIHGCNAKYFMDKEGKIHAGSRARWVAGDNAWTHALTKEHDLISRILKENPNCVLFGQVYGKVQDLSYGQENVGFVPFDLYDTKLNKFLPASALMTFCPPSQLFVGTLRGAIDEARQQFCDMSFMADGKNISEGAVIRPLYHDLFTSGRSRMRLITKVVSDKYLSRKNGTEYQ